jgi:hypothetical protein
MGKLDIALDEAPGKGWLVVDMKADRATVFPAVIPWHTLTAGLSAHL